MATPTAKGVLDSVAPGQIIPLSGLLFFGGLFTYSPEPGGTVQSFYVRVCPEGS